MGVKSGYSEGGHPAQIDPSSRCSPGALSDEAFSDPSPISQPPVAAHIDAIDADARSFRRGQERR